MASALHPNRVRAAVLVSGYTIQNTVASARPGAPETARRLWYQWYFGRSAATCVMKMDLTRACA